MTRQQASELLRFTLDAYDLKDWHVRLTTDVTKPYLGLCSYKDKAIILNAHHIDTHPEIEVRNTIFHEVAHALCPNHQHDDVWATFARNLGCDNTEPCAHYSLSEEAIDAIRSGADLVVTFEEQTIRKPKYEVKRLQDYCTAKLKDGNECGKVLKQFGIAKEFISGGKRYKKIAYECGHIRVILADSQTLFENFITFEHRNNNCKHEWNKNKCTICDASRPFPFQIEGMRALERANGRLALFDEMGLGKTIQSLGYIAYHEDALPVLYVVKSGIKFQWLQQIVTWLGPNYFGQVLSSSKENFLPGLKTYIVSYDIWRRMDQEKIEHLINTIKPKTLILDECQQIKNPDSSRTQMIRALAKKIPNIIPLSGTPWKNRGSEFFVVLNMLDPKRFWSYEAFKRQWVDTYWDGNKQKEGGIANPKKFKEYIKDLAIRRERNEVMPELPSISRNKLIAEVPENIRTAYNVAKQKLIDDYNVAVIGGEENTFGAQSKVMQNLILMRQIVGMAKIPATVDFIQEFLEDTERKLVVFVHHKECGIQIYNQMVQWCAENSYPQPLKLTAEMSSQERFECAELFNSPSRRLLIASTLASGEGLNLQTCSDCIMHERQWNPANEEQAEGRFIRIGQMANAVTATYIHGNETIDTQLDKIVERKRVSFANTMNEKGYVGNWSQDNIIKELVESIIKGK